MFKKTAIALGLAMVAGTGMAAQGTMNTNTKASVGASAAGQHASTSSDAALRTRFNALDSDGDGVISRSEAADSEQLADMYDSLNTSETIEDRAKESNPNGLTFDQFQAGMQAYESGSGTVGPAVSGGQTYTIMRDGTRKMKDSAGSASSSMKQRATDAMSSMENRGQSMKNGATQRGGDMRDATSDRVNSMKDAAGKTRMKGDAMNDSVRQRMDSATSYGAGANVEGETDMDTNQ